MIDIRAIDANALKEAISELDCAFGSVYRDDVYGAIDNAPTLEISPQDKALNEIIKYLKDDTVTWRDISDDIIIQILEDNGLW